MDVIGREIQKEYRRCYIGVKNKCVQISLLLNNNDRKRTDKFIPFFPSDYQTQEDRTIMSQILKIKISISTITSCQSTTSGQNHVKQRVPIPCSISPNRYKSFEHIYMSQGQSLLVLDRGRLGRSRKLKSNIFSRH